MRRAGVRTTLAWHCRVSWRWLRTRAVLAQLALEEWWQPESPADEWDEHAINEAIAAAAPVATAVTWLGPNWSLHPDGRSDIWVQPLGEGHEWRMVDAFLQELDRPLPREILG